MFDEDVEVSETRLPGVGIRHDFLTDAGRRVGVVAHRNGKRDLVVFSKDDPDSCSQVVTLSGPEADALAGFLGNRRVIERLANLSEQVAGLAVGKVKVAHGSRFDGLALTAIKAKRTGASVVAVLHDGEMVPSPDPERSLTGGDVLIVVGTAESIETLRDLVAG
ncbi:cation:proton antiporter regulatory subunit [Nakamurella endophytica]|uniref:Potassium transporter TrkA n=1 Tax=Nakamurella endophytica TaxID=1748367 RepID=A0A917T4R5_9ACTN|nr:cation:proton antiporter regulatory subunit [Nakamurella endophytica]GGM10418.1 potassium transporter TrkA [Nakamurella endophytica]